MPPIAWISRRWHVLMHSRLYEFMKCVVIVTSARSASTKSGWLRNFLMQLKM